MLKKIFFLLFVSIFLCNASFAVADYSKEEQKFVEYQANKTINNAKIYRAALYKTLGVTPPQAIEIRKLDKQFYEQIKPVLIEDYKTLSRLTKITNQKNPPKRLVNMEKKKLKENSKVLDEYKDNYESELYKVLTQVQKDKYLKLRKERLREYKISHSR